MRISAAVPTVLLVAMACSCSESNTGSEGSSCYPNKTCNSGLVCVQGECIRRVDAATVDAKRGDMTGSDQLPVDQLVQRDLSSDSSSSQPDSTAGACVANGEKDGAETDVDCGRSCASACADDKHCIGGPDCQSGVCTNNSCVAPSCSDRVKNGTESDIDCGGVCRKCVPHEACAGPADCDSGVCTSKICAEPSCADRVKNGSETDIDCGGSCKQCDIGASCSQSADCRQGICDTLRCRHAKSCKELHSAQAALIDAVYTIDPDGAGSSAPFAVYCDMTTDGGGWTALLNPVGNPSLPNPHIPTLTATTAKISGVGTPADACFGKPVFVAAGSWNSLQIYSCSDLTIATTISWVNVLGATDLMFVAALQGETTREISANGNPIAHDALTSGYQQCAFWNGTGASSYPAANECWKTMLDAPPHVYNSRFSGSLALRIATGPACAPSCSFGSGMNIQRLFVR